MKILKYKLKAGHLLILILFAAFALRIWGIGKESFWLDEAITARQSSFDINTSLSMIKEDTHFPLYAAIMAAWAGIFGISEISLRFPSLIFNLISVCIIYLIGKKLFSVKAGLIASLIMCISPASIYYSQEARLYALFLMLTLLSFYFYLRLLEKISILNIFFYVLFTEMMIYTHIFSALTVFAQSIFFIYANRKSGKSIILWMQILASELIIFLPWFYVMIDQILHNGLRMWLPEPNLYFVLKGFEIISGGLPFLMLAGVALFVAMKNKNLLMHSIDKIKMLLLFSLFPFFAVLIFSLVSANLFYPKYFFFLSGYIILILAFFLDRLSGNKKYAAIMPAFILISLALISYQYIINDKQDWRGVFAVITMAAGEEDTIFLYPFYYSEAFAYYHEPSCLSEPYVPLCLLDRKKVMSVNYMSDCCNDETETTLRELPNRLGDYINGTVWLIEPDYRLYPVDDNFFKYLSSGKKLTLEARFAGDIIIYRFE